MSGLKWQQENSLLLSVDSGGHEVSQEGKGKELGFADMGEVSHVWESIPKGKMQKW